MRNIFHFATSHFKFMILCEYSQTIKPGNLQNITSSDDGDRPWRHIGNDVKAACRSGPHITTKKLKKNGLRADELGKTVKEQTQFGFTHHEQRLVLGGRESRRISSRC